MKSMTIIPFEKVGEVPFGMERKSVRVLLGKYTEFKKNKFSTNTSDLFTSVVAFYDSQNKIEAFEFSRGVDLQYNGSNIFQLNSNTLKNTFVGIPYKLEQNVVVFSSLGIEVTLEDGVVSSVFVHCKDY